MARGSTQATGAATSAQDFSNGLQSNASSLFSTLAPDLESAAAHPSGYSPTDMAGMTTAAEQSAGGSTAGATGQGALLASRTKNAGTADAAIGQAARSGGQALSKASTGIAQANANQKQSNQRAALSGLENLESGQVTGANQALGDVAPNINANTNAENASYDWSNALFQPLLGAAEKSQYGKFV
jgi:hypothetical protein